MQCLACAAIGDDHDGWCTPKKDQPKCFSAAVPGSLAQSLGSLIRCSQKVQDSAWMQQQTPQLRHQPCTQQNLVNMLHPRQPICTEPSKGPGASLRKPSSSVPPGVRMQSCKGSCWQATGTDVPRGMLLPGSALQHLIISWSQQKEQLSQALRWPSCQAVMPQHSMVCNTSHLAFVLFKIDSVYCWAGACSRKRGSRAAQPP